MSGFKDFHGDTFRDDVSVFLKTDNQTISGSIKLAGKDTVVDLFSNKPIGIKTTEEGWFDQILFKDHRVKGDDKILLHDALVVGGPEDHRNIDLTRTKVFPNKIVYDAQFLTEDFKLKRLSFSLEKLRYFFIYGEIEQHSFYEREGDAKQLVEIARNATKQYWASRKENYGKKEHDFNNVESAFFVHSMSDELKFSANGLEHHIWMGRHSGHPFGGINTRSKPYLNIYLDAYHSIDDAFEILQSWHFYFNQVAYERLDLLSLSASASDKSDGEHASFYLPNFVSDLKKPEGRFHPSYVPFKLWRERASMMSLMKKWLEKNSARKSFRSMLNSTLSGRIGGDYVTQIGKLCAAIDSLEEIQGERHFSKEHVSELAQATSERAQSLELDISLGRIKGLLGNLNQPSLKDKIRYVFANSGVKVDHDELSKFLKIITGIRRISAHGSEQSRDNMPIAYVAAEALKSVCVLFDLNSSGRHLDNFETGQLLANETFQIAFADVMRISSGDIATKES